MSLFRGDSWRLEHTGMSMVRCRACWLESAVLLVPVAIVVYALVRR